MSEGSPHREIFNKAHAKARAVEDRVNGNTITGSEANTLLLQFKEKNGSTTTQKINLKPYEKKDRNGNPYTSFQDLRKPITIKKTNKPRK